METLRNTAVQMLAGNTTALCAQLLLDIGEINEPAKILKFVDLIIAQEKSHKQHNWSAAATCAVALPNIVNTVVVAHAIAENCEANADGTKNAMCGLSASQAAGAVGGILAVGITGGQLYKNYAEVTETALLLDQELERKLSKVRGKQQIVEQRGAHLISRFANLSKDEQNQIRNQLAGLHHEPVAPLNLVN